MKNHEIDVSTSNYFHLPSNVNVTALNDSYHVGLSIYNVAICCAVAAPLSLFNVGNLAVTYGLVASFMLLCATTSLCLLFFPKVHQEFLCKIDFESNIVLFNRIAIFF